MNISLYFCNDDLVNNIMQMVVDLVQKKIFVRIYLVYETKVLVGSYQNRFCTKEDHCKVAVFKLANHIRLFWVKMKVN